MEHQAIELEDRPFLVFTDSGESVSYGEFNERVDALAMGLRRLGVGLGDRVCMMLSNRVEFVLTWFATTKLGAVHVPINVHHKGDVLTYVVNDSGAETLVLESEYAGRIAALVPELTRVRRIAMVGDDGGAFAGARNAHGEAVEIVDFASIAIAGERLENRPAAMPWTPEAIVYTSGTTGPSKGALACHHHRLVIAESWMHANEFGRGDTLYAPFPFFHPIGTTLGILPVLLAGGTIVVAPRFSASRYWREAGEHGATHGHILFSLAFILLKQPPSPYDRAHKVRRVHIASSTIADEFEQRFGARITEVWGGGEAGMFTYTPPGITPPSGSCGLASPRYEVAVFDDNDLELPNGQIGEMVARPKEPWILPLEYLNKPQQSFESMRNGWFHLGDLGYRDDDGFFYFADRKKDSMRRRGEMVSSYEVESVINAHPSVLESAALGIDSGLAKGDQDILVHIVLAEGAAFDPEALIKHCDDNMAFFMVPRFLYVRESMPKTPTDKIAKYQLRDELLPNGAWDRESADIRLTR
ncbi:AMP-binding protein [Rhodococcus sp. NPDC127530]|uniref:AMP-binding protein n=1 Tax=unclassified Rhodococcus (in: high G+C Gram-positive bacteria) TaxID=192944 RepID=UPI00363547D2